MSATGRFLDISLPLGPDLLTWPGDPGFELEPARRIAAGGGANVSQVRMGTHTGTHLDPPSHFLEDAPAVDAIAPETLVGPAHVVDLRSVERSIGPAELAALPLPRDAERLLFKTRNSEIWGRRPVAFPEDYVALSPEGATWVVQRGIRLVGTDFLSIEHRREADHSTHRRLLEAGVVILEGLDLREVDAGPYLLACLPLRLVGGDGGPARAFLIDDSPLLR